MIDTHCHLTFPDLGAGEPARVQQVLADAAAAGVTGCITISTTTRDCLDALRIARAHDRVWCTAGVHPLYAAPGKGEDTAASGDSSRSARLTDTHDWANLALVASDPKCVAWGELGLDQHYQDPPQGVQRRVLDEQLAFIESCHRRENARTLPVVIHCREAFDDLIPILRASSLSPERFVFHCFTAGPREMRQVLDFGAMVSFTGVITYPNAPHTREAALLVPPDRLMVETDAPFLSPVPHRGKKPCIPAYTADTARALAALRSTPFETFHQQVNANTERFFGIR